MERGTAPAEAVLETLISRGWRFRDPDEIRAMIRSKTNSSLESIESELLNMDLRSVGGKSLPEASALRKSSYLQGPKVLQLVSVRDIYKSNIDASFKNSEHHRRLLRFILTDGHSEVTAIEYAFVPSITEEIIPGTKVYLGNKIMIHSGILCLNPKVVTILGGLVQSLYEEWQMSQKYSGFSRTSLRRSPNDDGVGPPPFEKLEIETRPYQVSQLRGSHADRRESAFKISSHISGKSEEHQLVNRGWNTNDTEAYKVVDDSTMISSTRKAEDKPSSSEARPKEVSEAVPVQNQAAAQKLLQKMSNPTQEDKHPRGPKHRFRGKQEEAPVFTLDEWERRKGSNSNNTLTGETFDVSRDEELARQLQNQLDFEDFHGRTGNAEAEQIRMNMFSFVGEEESRNDGGRGFRGRGRGFRGRGRGFRGRGKRRFG